VKKLKTDQIKNILVRRGLSTIGDRNVIVERLEEALAAEEAERERRASEVG